MHRLTSICYEVDQHYIFSWQNWVTSIAGIWFSPNRGHYANYQICYYWSFRHLSQAQLCNAFICFTMILPLLITRPHGWSNKKSLKLLHSGSTPGSLHKQVGRKNGKACRVFNAAKHFVTVTVLQATEKKKILRCALVN